MRENPLFNSRGGVVYDLADRHIPTLVVVVGSDIGIWTKLVQVKYSTVIYAEITGKRLMNFTGIAKLLG